LVSGVEEVKYVYWNISWSLLEHWDLKRNLSLKNLKFAARFQTLFGQPAALVPDNELLLLRNDDFSDDDEQFLPTDDDTIDSDGHDDHESQEDELDDSDQETVRDNDEEDEDDGEDDERQQTPISQNRSTLLNFLTEDLDDEDEGALEDPTYFPGHRILVKPRCSPRLKRK